MATAYTANEHGETTELPAIRCDDEGKELQNLLANNLDLLPGDQINPEEPRRWLLIKKEMAVPDPSSGTNRWSVDFFLGDQEATPTFVECKRFADTRARREVIGQMMEYVANAHYYWSAETMRAMAQESLGSDDLDTTIRQIVGEGEPGGEYFDALEENLREGQLRMVFFLEEAPQELKSIVDFLNKQMQRSEVLIVEAKMFANGDQRIVVPSLFGYTEEARRVKRTVTVSSGRITRKWDEHSFFEDVLDRHDDRVAGAMKGILAQGRSLDFTVRWGSGKATGSFSFIAPRIFHRSVASVYSDGYLWFNTGWLRGNPEIEELRARLSRRVADAFGIEDDGRIGTRHLPIVLSNWMERQNTVAEILTEIAHGTL